MNFITTQDGERLALRRFRPEGSAADARANVLILGAMGVRQDYYAPFARHLAAQGFAVTTFDYRGMGHSRRGSLRGFETDITTWATRDVPAALEAARAVEGPLYLVAHSLGGQILGLVPGREKVDGMFTVASGTGYFRHNRRMPLQLLYLWYVAMPLYTRLFGYFPGKRLRKVGDLPRGVALQWTRWCRHPHYLVDDQGRPITEGHANIRIPIFGLSFEDDEYIPRVAIDQLHGYYRAARVERRHVQPSEIGARRIGHFGFFNERFAESLWPVASRWLNDRLAPQGEFAAPVAGGGSAA